MPDASAPAADAVTPKFASALMRPWQVILGANAHIIARARIFC
jgi:hypothetical protein